MDEVYSNSYPSTGDVSPCEETNLSSEDKYSFLLDYESPSNPLQSIDSVCDITDVMLLDWRILSNAIRQRDTLRADLLQHVEGVLDTLAKDLSLLYQTRNHLISSVGSQDFNPEIRHPQLFRQNL